MGISSGRRYRCELASDGRSYGGTLLAKAADTIEQRRNAHERVVDSDRGARDAETEGHARNRESLVAISHIRVLVLVARCTHCARLISRQEPELFARSHRLIVDQDRPRKEAAAFHSQAKRK